MSQDKKAARKKFNDEVFARDGHKCRFCGRKVALDAHHIKDRHEMPNGGYVKENGISLCTIPFGLEPSCHEKAEKFHITGGKEWTPGMHPDDLYRLIGSSETMATKASLMLSCIVKRDTKLKTWDEVEAFQAKHLKPAGHSPKGHPIYNASEMAELRLKYRLVFPDEDGPFDP